MSITYGSLLATVELTEPIFLVLDTFLLKKQPRMKNWEQKYQFHSSIQ